MRASLLSVLAVVLAASALADDKVFIPLEDASWRARFGDVLEALDGGRARKAIDLLHDGLAQNGHRLVLFPVPRPKDLDGFRDGLAAAAALDAVPVGQRLGERRFLPASTVARWLLGLFPDAALAEYRKLRDPVLAAALAAAGSDGAPDRVALERALTEALHASRADVAAELAGDFAFEAGDWRRAASWWRFVLEEHRGGEVPRERVREKLDALARHVVRPRSWLPGGGVPAAFPARTLVKSWDSRHWSRRGLEQDRTPAPRIDPEDFGGIPRNFIVRGAHSYGVAGLDEFPFVPSIVGSFCYLSGVYDVFCFDARPDAGSLLVEYEKPTPRAIILDAPYIERSNSTVYTVAHWSRDDASPPLRRSLPETFPANVLVTQYISDRIVADSFMGYDITVEIPIRSLVAFDADTRRMLWKTATEKPAPLRRRVVQRVELVHKETLSYVAPPIIRDGLVISAGWVQRGYIDIVARAHDLRDGSLVWETFLCGFQAESTMFGEVGREPFACTLTETDGVIYCLTQAGVVAALETRSGAVEWLTTYDTIPYEATLGRRAELRDVVWGHCPPLVLGDLVVVTPRDSDHLYGISRGGATSGDAAGGRVLWRHHNSHGVLRDLLGYHDRYLYFTGLSGVAAVDVGDFLEAGDRAPGPASDEPPALLLTRLPRSLAIGPGVLTRDGVVFSDESRLYLHQFEPAAGTVRVLCETTDGPGRLTLGGGFLYLTSRNLLSVYEGRP